MSCTLCGAKGPRTGCPRCEDHQPSLFSLPPPPPPTERELARAREEERLHVEGIAVRRGKLYALSTLGRPITVALVGCAKHKATHRSQARDLYHGRLFALSLRYAERCTDLQFILSALHALVRPDEELDPYDFGMSELRVRDRERWGERVAVSLETETRSLTLRLVGLAGEDYLKPLLIPFAGRGWMIEKPLVAMGVGSRVGWLTKQLAAFDDEQQPRRTARSGGGR